ncbi:MAG: hypothetical protein Q4E99_01550 [Bacillota bacterium]|nr:hypothetical protein [Bacillota bacterium]
MEIIDLNRATQIELYGHSSKGNQPKWKIEEYWYKADYAGYEALSEVLISHLISKTNFAKTAKHVDYCAVKIQYDGKEYIGCKSKNFKKPNQMLIPITRLHRQFKAMSLNEKLATFTLEEGIKYTVDFITETTNIENFGTYLQAMLELDALFLNEDRHTNNIAVLYNEDKDNFEICPIFDFGLSLCSDLNDYPLDQDIYKLCGKVYAKPFVRSFDEQLEAISKLYGYSLEYSFTKKDIEAELKNLSEYYPAQITDRVYDLLAFQMNHYGIR